MGPQMPIVWNMDREGSHGLKFGSGGLFLVTTSANMVHKVVHGPLRVSWSTFAGKGMIPQVGQRIVDLITVHVAT